MSGFVFCFYCRKIWFPWLIKCESLRRPRNWEYLFEKVVIPFHCPLPIGSETEKAEQKPHHPRLLLSLQSSRCCLCRHLVLPLEWFNHKAVTGKASKAARRAQWQWAHGCLHGLRGGLLQRGTQSWCAQEPSLQMPCPVAGLSHTASWLSAYWAVAGVRG